MKIFLFFILSFHFFYGNSRIDFSELEINKGGFLQVNLKLPEDVFPDGYKDYFQAMIRFKVIYHIELYKKKYFRDEKLIYKKIINLLYYDDWTRSYKIYSENYKKDITIETYGELEEEIRSINQLELVRHQTIQKDEEYYFKIRSQIKIENFSKLYGIFFSIYSFFNHSLKIFKSEIILGKDIISL